MNPNAASVGRIVHVVLDKHIAGIKSHAIGEHRPAVVVRTWGENGGPSECVNLQVLVDGTNDVEDGTGPIWLTSVSYNGATNPPTRTWHWPERE